MSQRRNSIWASVSSTINSSTATAGGVATWTTSSSRVSARETFA